VPAFRDIIPDYAFLFACGGGMLACLAEVLSGEESTKRIEEKLKKYESWEKTAEAQDFLTTIYRWFGARDPRPYFRALFVVQNRRTGNDNVRLRQLVRITLSLPPTIQRRVWIATVQDLETASSVNAPIWICGQDLAASESSKDAVLRSLRCPSRSGSTSTFPRRRLFPFRDEQSCVCDYDTRSH
jgi:hypothetical protein